MRVVEEGYDQSVLNNSLSVRPVVDLAIGLLATSHSDIQGVRITKSFSPGDEATNNLGLEEMGWFYAHLPQAEEEALGKY